MYNILYSRFQFLMKRVLFISGTRNVVAECLGKLCLICPENLLPQLQAALTSPSPLMRTTVVTAMKFTISDQPQVNDCFTLYNFHEFIFCDVIMYIFSLISSLLMPF